MWKTVEDDLLKSARPAASFSGFGVIGRWASSNGRGAAEARGQLVVDQPSAAPRQDGWAAGETRSLLLADAGRGASDAATVRGDAPADLGALGADRLIDEATGDCREAKRRRKTGEVSARMSAVSCRPPRFGSPGGPYDARSM
jgi:hypothetical protein